MGLHLFIGSLNREAPYFQGARGVGLSVFSFDEDTLALEKRSETGSVDNPTFMAFAPRRNVLYANSEVFGWHEGVTSAYRFDPASGALHYLNKQPTLGSIPAYASVSADERFLFVANYAMGRGGPDQSIAVFAIAADGSLKPAGASVAHLGSGPDASRQERSHAHCVVPTPDGRLILVTDLGLDTVIGYRVAADGGLAKVSECPMAPGAGPRHLVFHPDGQLVFVMNELAATISTLRREVGDRLSLLGTVSAVPETSSGDSQGADIRITPDGRFVYGSIRGADLLVTLGVDPQSGRLTPLAFTKSGGETPRNFAITPSGRHLLVANQNSDAVVIFSRDAATGALIDTGRRIEIGTPVCVLAVPQ